jgi:hypothetical protein
MSNIQVNYTGDGATVLYTITFDYLRRAHVKASINGSNTTGFTFANDTTIQFNSAPANGAAIILFRETPADAVNNTFFPNSSISSESLNDNFRQTLLVSEEAREIAADAQLGNLVPGSIGTVTLADGAVTSVKIADGTIVNADINASAAIADTKLATISTAGKVSNSATTATSSNTVSAIVARDGSGNFSAGTITANLTGTASAIADNIVTSAKIVDGTIVDGDISATAEIAVSKLADGAARQLLQTDAAGTGVEWTDNVDVPGTLDVTGAATLDSTLVVAGDVTVPSLNGGPLAGTRNRIINGDMRIDQRNGGASVTTNEALPVDRWKQNMSGGGVLTSNRSTVAPTGFINSLLATVSTADASIAAGDFYNLNQRIEGFNVDDFGFGTANAQTVTLSFWARSSVTGTFAGCLGNSAANRSYTFTYSISTANTWEYKTVTIPGDIGGTWLVDNGIGIRVVFDLGSGSDSQGTAGAWQSGFKSATAAAVKLISTLNANFYITGVQLEPGTVATPFERRSFGQELALCQRYFLDYGTFHIGINGNSNAQGDGAFLVEMRAAPTVSFTDASGVASQVSVWNGTFNSTTFGSGGFNPSTKRLVLDAAINFSSGTSSWLRAYNVKLSAEL